MERDPRESRAAIRDFPREQILDQIDHAEYFQPNTAGWVIRAIEQNYRLPPEMIRQREKKAKRAADTIAADEGRKAEQAETRQREAVNERERVETEREIAGLDDAALEQLSAEVIDKYSGNTAVLSVLRSKPPRQCNLMKMEVTALLKARAVPAITTERELSPVG